MRGTTNRSSIDGSETRKPRMKKFRIMADEFRNRLKRYDMMADIVSGLVNFRIMGTRGLPL